MKRCSPPCGACAPFARRPSGPPTRRTRENPSLTRLTSPACSYRYRTHTKRTPFRPPARSRGARTQRPPQRTTDGGWHGTGRTARWRRRNVVAPRASSAASAAFADPYHLRPTTRSPRAAAKIELPAGQEWDNSLSFSPFPSCPRRLAFSESDEPSRVITCIFANHTARQRRALFFLSHSARSSVPARVT